MVYSNEIRSRKNREAKENCFDCRIQGDGQMIEM